jgi:hypothetical protein
LYWSWIITALTLFSMYFVEQKRKEGWLVSFGTQAVWILYALTTKQYGFLAPAPFFIVLYARNYVRWAREEKRLAGGGA